VELRRILADVLARRVAPRNLVGMLRHDRRREGRLAVGDRAPDAVLSRLDGGETRLSELVGERPLVLIFGSFT
jgi:hypothetical protein